jgi:alginate production protein
VWVGGTLNGRAGPAWSYWGDAAVRRGRAGATRLGGWALDGGVAHRWAAPWLPTLTFGFATGSGDSAPADDRQTRFRQTGLEDNQAYFGGLRRVGIYGDVFDPELSNLRVLTAGLGVRPLRQLAIDTVYHHFLQATPTTSSPSGNLNGALNGISPALGHELDVVLTFRAMTGLDLDLSAGVFIPGRAWAGPPKPAFFWRPQIRYYF